MDTNEPKANALLLVVGVLATIHATNSLPWLGDLCLDHAIALGPVAAGALVALFFSTTREANRASGATLVLAPILGGATGFATFHAVTPDMSGVEWPPCFVLLALIVAPVVEESFWRGRIFARLGVFALPVTSVGFALYHAIAGQTTDGFATYILYGLTFGAVRQISRSVSCSMLAHTITNALILWSLA